MDKIITDIPFGKNHSSEEQVVKDMYSWILAMDRYLFNMKIQYYQLPCDLNINRSHWNYNCFFINQFFCINYKFINIDFVIVIIINI